MNLGLDTYSLKARTFPVLIVIAPSFLVGISNVKSLEWYYRLPAGFVLLSLAAFLFSQIARFQGRKKEAILFSKWGGKPTTVILRHRDSHLDSHTKQRYFDVFGERLKDIQRPSPEAEGTNPNDADSIYESCTRQTIAATRDNAKHPLVFKENVNYGFCRNLWSLKFAGLVIAFGSLATEGLILQQRYATVAEVTPSDWIVSALLVLDILFWLFIVTPDFVRTPAFQYAERLFESLETVGE